MGQKHQKLSFRSGNKEEFTTPIQELAWLCETHQDGGRLDDLDGFGQRGRHGGQLVPDLL